MKLAIINYGMGNLSSVSHIFENLSVTHAIIDSPAELSSATQIILPGVGSFSEGISRLREKGWVDAIRKAVLLDKKPLLGICLGMQLLADTGEEGAHVDGLALIPGKVVRLDKLGCNQRIPHIGWNDIVLKNTCPLFSRIENGTDFYFVHSYAFHPVGTNSITAGVCYEIEIPAAISNNNIFGVQFHPEKSSQAGRQLLRNFLEYKSC